MSYTTRELSKRTWPDFEAFFNQVHGCACTLYSFGRHFTLEGKNAAERARIYGTPDRSQKRFPGQDAIQQIRFGAMKELVRTDRAHVTGKTLMHNGTMSMFERLGFEPVRRDTSDGMWWAPGDRVLMRLKV